MGVGSGAGRFFIPFIIAADRTIWQIKVAPALQGRVFAVQGMLRNCFFPVGFLLADRLFEPARQPDSAWAATFGWLVGVGPGAGMGLLFVCTAFFGAILSFSGYLWPAARNVERDLPDFDTEVADPAVALAQAGSRCPTSSRLTVFDQLGKALYTWYGTFVRHSVTPLLLTQTEKQCSVTPAYVQELYLYG